MKSWIYFFLGFTFLSGLLAWSLFCVPYLLTNDGPQHILSAYIENHYDDPGSIYPMYLKRLPQFAYRGFAVIMKPMERAFGWQLGSQFAVLIILLLNAWGFTAMVLALNPKRRWVAYLGFPLAWSWNLYMGFFAFMVGTGLGYWIVAYVLAIKKWNWVRWGTLAGLLWLQAIACVFTACVTGVVVAGLLILRQRIWVILLIGLPALTVAIRTLWHRSDVKEVFEASSGLYWLPWKQYMAMLPHLMMPGSWLNALPWLFLILLAIGIGFRRFLKGQLSHEEKILFWVGFVSILIVVLGPRDITGWQFFAQRFIPLGIPFLLILLPWERFGLLLFLGSLSSIIAFSETNKNLAYSCSDLITSLSSFDVRHGMNYFVPLSISCGLESPSETRLIPYMKPELQAGALFATATGSMPSSIFGGSIFGSAFTVEKIPLIVAGEAPFKKIGVKRIDSVDIFRFSGNEAVYGNKSLLYRLAVPGMGNIYEGIFVTGADLANVNLLKSMGFVEQQSYGTIWVGRFEPCKVTFKTSLLETKVPEINIGFYPFESSILIDVAGKKTTSGTYEYSYAPCGDVWIEVPSKVSGMFKIEDPQNRVYLKNRVFVKE